PHERARLSRRGSPARPALHLVCLGALPRVFRSAGPAHVPFLDYLSGAIVRPFADRSLAAGLVVIMSLQGFVSRRRWLRGAVTGMLALGAGSWLTACQRDTPAGFHATDISGTDLGAGWTLPGLD